MPGRFVAAKALTTELAAWTEVVDCVAASHNVVRAGCWSQRGHLFVFQELTISDVVSLQEGWSKRH